MILAMNIRAFIIIGSVMGPFWALNPSIILLPTSTFMLSLWNKSIRGKKFSCDKKTLIRINP